jgi:hypothetical protein
VNQYLTGSTAFAIRMPCVSVQTMAQKLIRNCTGAAFLTNTVHRFFGGGQVKAGGSSPLNAI